MDKWKKYLQSLGLSLGEIEVYMAALQLGAGPVQVLAEKTGLSRVSVYSAIENLTKLGLMSSVEKGKKQLYTAEPPERILSLAENKLNNLRAMTENIKSHIDELRLTQEGDRPTVRMFEGLEAFSVIQDEVVKVKGDRICEFGNVDEIDSVYPYEETVRKKYHNQLASKKNTKRQLIYLSPKNKTRAPEPNKEVIFLDSSKYKFFGDIFFYDDTVWISNFKNRQVSIMIKNQEIKDTIQAAFDILWENLNKKS